MTISDPYFCDSFGFTDSEVKKLLSYYELEDYYETVRDWYDGYRFGEISIYCPWDVIKHTQILLRFDTTGTPVGETNEIGAAQSGGERIVCRPCTGLVPGNDTG